MLIIVQTYTFLFHLLQFPSFFFLHSYVASNALFRINPIIHIPHSIKHRHALASNASQAPLLLLQTPHHFTTLTQAHSLCATLTSTLTCVFMRSHFAHALALLCWCMLGVMPGLLCRLSCVYALHTHTYTCTLCPPAHTCTHFSSYYYYLKTNQ